MDLILLFLGFALVVLGIIGSLLPILPGPVAGWFGLLLLFLTKSVPMNYYLLGITFFIALIIFILDYLIPGMGAKKFGGSSKGSAGATIGLLVGLLIPVPLGFVIGAFAGAFVGELIHDHKDLKRPLRSAYGSFVGLLASTAMKLFASLVFFVLFLYQVITCRAELFSF